MAKRLNTYVHVVDAKFNSVAFGPDDKIPAWAAKQIGDHCYEADEPTEGESTEGDAGDEGSTEQS